LTVSQFTVDGDVGSGRVIVLSGFGHCFAVVGVRVPALVVSATTAVFDTRDTVTSET